MRDQSILQAALRPGPGCPEIESLSIHLALPAGDPLRLASDSHLEACLLCSAEIRMLREFEAGIVRPEEVSDVAWIASRLGKDSAPAPVVPVETWWKRWFTVKGMAGVAALAAVALFAVGISTQNSNHNRSGQPVPEFGNEIQRAQVIDVVNTPGAFAWKPVPAAAQYEITVRTVDEKVVFHNNITNQTLAFPPEVAKIVVSGRQLWWEVVARDASGSQIAKSGVRRLVK